MSTEGTILTQQPDNQGANQPDAAAAAQPTGPKWRQSLAEDIRGEKMFDNIKGDSWDEAGPVLAKGYRDAQKLVGGALTRVPAKDAKPEEIAAWKTDNLGKLAEAGLIELPPAKIEDYKATLKVPAGRTADEKMVSTAKERFHKAGFSDNQIQTAFDLYSEMEGEARDALGGSVKDTLAGLEKEWGGALQDNLDLGHQAVLEVGGQALMDVLDSTGLGNHPALIKAFAKVGGILREDNPVFADSVRGGAAEAKLKLAAIMNDRKHAYWSTDSSKSHRDAVAEVTRLQEQVHGQA